MWIGQLVTNSTRHGMPV